jgi:DNA-binding transcriptional LysR family regulator
MSRSTGTSLGLIVAFAAAARQGSFAGAARDLGISPSAVSKNVARLEARMKVRLFHRTTRQISMSPDGEELYERCQRILAEVEALDASAADARTGLRGTLRIDLPITYGRLVVVPVLARLSARHPGLAIDARFSDQVVDLVKEGLDAAVRIGSLADSRLVARMFDQQVLYACASPAYLRRHGAPQSPDELSAHTCLTFRVPTSGRDRPWQFRHGRRDYTLSPDTGVRLGDGEALVSAAAAGMGLIQVPSYMAQQALQRRQLVEVLANYRPAPMPISLVYPSRRHTPLRVRMLAEALAARKQQSGA